MLVLNAQGNSHPKSAIIKFQIIFCICTITSTFKKHSGLPYLTMPGSLVSCDRPGFHSCRGDSRTLLLCTFLVLSGATFRIQWNTSPSNEAELWAAGKLQLTHWPGVLLQGSFLCFSNKGSYTFIKLTCFLYLWNLLSTRQSSPLPTI